MTRIAFPLLALLIVTTQNVVSAADEFDPKARVAAISPYMTENAIAVGHLDLSKINVEATLKQIADLINPEEQQRAEMLGAQQHIKDLIQKLNTAGAKEIYAVVNLTVNINQLGYLIVPVEQGGNHRAVAGILFGGNPDGPTSYEEARRQNYKGPRSHEICTQLGNVVFCGRKSLLEQLQRMKPQSRPEWEKAFAAAGDTTAQLAIVPSNDTRRVIREMLPKLPPELGGISGEALVAGLQWAAVGIDSPPKFSANLVIQSKDEASAKALQKFIKSIYIMAGQMPPVKKEFPMFEKLAELLTPKVEKDQLKLSLTKENQAVNKFVTLLSKPLEQSREAARRSQCLNNLKQFGLAMHNFHDVYKSFPPSASYDGKGKKLLSWRVYLLPFLDGPDLYKQFHLDEPWDSDHNKQLIEKMPRVFACPSAKPAKKGMTTYLAPLGEKMIFSGKTGVQIRDVTDGTSNTIMIVDADPKHAVIWTKPDDLKIDLAKPLTGLVGQHAGGFQAVFCDGAFHFISKNIKPETLKLLFMRNDGKVVGKY